MERIRGFFVVKSEPSGEFLLANVKSPEHTPPPHTHTSTYFSASISVLLFVFLLNDRVNSSRESTSVLHLLATYIFLGTFLFLFYSEFLLLCCYHIVFFFYVTNLCRDPYLLKRTLIRNVSVSSIYICLLPYRMNANDEHSDGKEKPQMIISVIALVLTMLNFVEWYA